MNLVLDIGNTNVKLGLFDNGEMIDHQLVGAFSEQYLRDFFAQKPGIKNLCISNTGSVFQSLESICKEFGIKYLNVDLECKLPILIKYDTPNNLGSDRIALASAASIKYPGDILVIDLGTCITYDVVLKKTYIGGKISPGLKMRLLALNNYTAYLPYVDFKRPKNLIAQSTEEAILLGVFEGIVSEINNTIENYKLRYPDMSIILTGGDVSIFQKDLQSINFIHHYLLMHGLNYIIACNE